MRTSPYPIYVINLKRTPERKLYMQRQLEALGLNYQFVDAIDKYDLQSPQYRSEIAGLLGIDKSIIEYKYFSNHTGSMACALSHVKVYNLMAENNHLAACVLEDDVVISPDFFEILQATQRVSWDILKLSHRSKTVMNVVASNPIIQAEMEECTDMDYSLFPRWRKIRWHRKLLLLVFPFWSQLDWIPISKVQWYKLMIFGYSRIARLLYGFVRSCKTKLRKFYNSKLGSRLGMVHTGKGSAENWAIDCKIGGLPIVSSQQTLYGNYNIAVPAEYPGSGMAYLLTLVAASKCKEMVNNIQEIDLIPWHLYCNNSVQLRIITPPCVSTLLAYLRNSPRK